jgi:hypothetical protein
MWNVVFSMCYLLVIRTSVLVTYQNCVRHSPFISGCCHETSENYTCQNYSDNNKDKNFCLQNISSSNLIAITILIVQ